MVQGSTREPEPLWEIEDKIFIIVIRPSTIVWAAGEVCVRLSPWVPCGPEVMVGRQGVQLEKKKKSAGCEMGENKDKLEPLTASPLAASTLWIWVTCRRSCVLHCRACRHLTQGWEKLREILQVLKKPQLCLVPTHGSSWLVMTCVRCNSTWHPAHHQAVVILCLPKPMRISLVANRTRGGRGPERCSQM